MWFWRGIKGPTDDDHVDDEHTQVIDHDANLQEGPSGASERVADGAGVRSGFGCPREF